MNFPFLIIMEVVFAGLLAAATTRFNLQVVGANLPDCNQDELATTVKQTTGFALIAGALSVQASDNLLQCGWHSFQTSLWVTAIMSAVLLWQSLPAITAAACDAIDEAAEELAEKGTKFASTAKVQFISAVQTARQPKQPNAVAAKSAEQFPNSASNTELPSEQPNNLTNSLTSIQSKFSFLTSRFSSLRFASLNAERPLAARRFSGTAFIEKIKQLTLGIIGQSNKPQKLILESSDQMPQTIALEPDQVSDSSKANPQEIDYQTQGEQQHVLL